VSKLPSLQFYPGDWRKDPGVQSLSFHDRGVWFEILLLMHESEQRGKLLLNGQKMPEDALARLLGLDKQILTTTLTTLLEYGVASLCDKTGCIVCRRMVRDEQLREVRKKAGKLGGNPALLKQTPKQKPTTHVKQIPTPSSSVSVSSSVSSSEEKETIKEKVSYTPGAGIVVPPRINLPEVIEAVGAWVNWRYFKDVQHSVFADSPQEQSVWETINRWGVTPEQIITRIHECVANGWNRLIAPETPLHHGNAAATDLEDTWDELTTFLGKIPPGEPYTDRITAKFGSKVAALVKKFGYNEIKTANDFEDSRLKKRFVREMQS
jgi:hypothetical protein